MKLNIETYWKMWDYVLGNTKDKELKELMKSIESPKGGINAMVRINLIEEYNKLKELEDIK